MKSLIDASSTRVAIRQPAPRVAQYARPASTVYVGDETVFCQVRQVTLSVTVPSPLSR